MGKILDDRGSDINGDCWRIRSSGRSAGTGRGGESSDGNRAAPHVPAAFADRIQDRSRPIPSGRGAGRSSVKTAGPALQKTREPGCTGRRGITPARKFRMFPDTSPKRQRGECQGSLAGASGWYEVLSFPAGVI